MATRSCLPMDQAQNTAMLLFLWFTPSAPSGRSFPGRRLPKENKYSARGISGLPVHCLSGTADLYLTLTDGLTLSKRPTYGPWIWIPQFYRIGRFDDLRL
ncbi:hypothetical protein ACMYSQ_011433 [Aspergillus niger]